jgi:hypothetical protein
MTDEIPSAGEPEDEIEDDSCADPHRFCCLNGHDMTAQVCKAVHETVPTYKLFRAKRAPNQPRRILVKCYVCNPPLVQVFRASETDCSDPDATGGRDAPG